MKQPIVYWFRLDLRLDDLPGLQAAIDSGMPVLPVFVLDDDTAGAWSTGGASRWWLHHSLASLQAELEALGAQLLLRRGAASEVLPAVARECNAAAVYCSRMHEPWSPAMEAELHDTLEAEGIAFKRFPGSLLFEPERVSTGGGTPFKVFTPFWKACLALGEPAAPLQRPARLDIPDSVPRGLSLADLELRPRNPDWAAHWIDLWQPGSRGASDAVSRFLAGPVADYDEGRNHPAREATSRLSPHMHFGEISPRQVWHLAQAACGADPSLAKQRDKFLSELGWREFSHHLLHHFPEIVEQPFREGFANFPWLGNEDMLSAWQRGMTGYPLVDAGMRELWQTGYMHNRVRMVTASFLTKHLLVHWRRGEAWFRDTLVDADLANNVCGWQWVAGSGADAAPYFRIFNPTVQGQRYDEDGDYIRRWVPELAGLPTRHLHDPSAAPAEVLAAAGVEIGTDYPAPIVDHREAREAALAAYASIK